jgi:IS30 family transposase
MPQPCRDGHVNGCESAHGRSALGRFTATTRIQVYLCDPESPWQRRSNENTDGLLRQYLPRRLDFRTLTQADFDAITLGLSHRPRRTLGFKTPAQALAEVLR